MVNVKNGVVVDFFSEELDDSIWDLLFVSQLTTTNIVVMGFIDVEFCFGTSAFVDPYDFFMTMTKDDPRYQLVRCRL